MFKPENRLDARLRAERGQPPASRERLRPALLERLTDRAPQQQVESEPPGTSTSALRGAVLRDLAWLFNCTSMAADVDLDPYPEVRESVLNYGILPLAGKHISELDSQDLAAKLRLAILKFEPRLLPDSVEVRCLTDVSSIDLHNEMAFEIRARMWSQPYPVEFLVRSDIDIESGHTVLHNLVAD